MSETVNGRRGALPSGVSHSGDLQDKLREFDYLSEDGLATAIFLALKLGRPLFLEGDGRFPTTEEGLNALIQEKILKPNKNGKVLDKVGGAREWDSPEIVNAIMLTFRIKM